jgi:hypothetical protein
MRQNESKSGKSRRRLANKGTEYISFVGKDESSDADIDMDLAFARAGRFVAALTASLEGAAAGLDAGARRQLDTVAESLGGEDAE